MKPKTKQSITGLLDAIGNLTTVLGKNATAEIHRATKKLNAALQAARKELEK